MDSIHWLLQSSHEGQSLTNDEVPTHVLERKPSHGTKKASCSRDSEVQYITTKQVAKGQELIADYGESYWVLWRLNEKVKNISKRRADLNKILSLAKTTKAKARTQEQLIDLQIEECGCALGCFFVVMPWLLHFPVWGYELGKNAMGAIKRCVPYIDGAHGKTTMTTPKGILSGCLMVTHHDQSLESSWWIIMMHHHDSSWWVIMMIHHD